MENLNIVFCERDYRSFKTDSLVFIKDNWNDYGYLDMFNVKYIDDKNIISNIGNIRIITSFDSIDTLDCIEEKNDRQTLNNHFVSMGEDLDFYTTLFSVFDDQDRIENILSNINDILVSKPGEMEFNDINGTLIKNKVLCFGDAEKTIFRDSSMSVYELNYLFQKQGLSFLSFLNRKNSKKSFDNFKKDKNLVRQLKNYFNNNSGLVIDEFVEFLVEHIIPDNSKVDESQKELVEFLEVLKEKYTLNPKISEKLNDYLSTDKNLVKINDSVDKIKQHLLVKEGELQVNIGHYTTLETINYLIKDEKEIHDNQEQEKDNYPYMRLTNINQLNDSLEGKVLSQYLGIKSTHISHSYVSCATTAEDSLPMWNLYANNASGVFLVYDIEFLEGIINDQNIEFYHVCYIDKENDNVVVPSIKNHDDCNDTCQTIKKELKSIKNSYKKLSDQDIKRQAEQLIENISFLFKNIEYCYEEELRFYISPRVDQISLIMKKDFPFPFLYTNYDARRLKYSKLILGPKENINLDYISPYIDYISERNAYKKRIEVIKSNRHFR